MTGEGSEYGGKRREIDEDETDRIVREIIDEVRKEIEEREASETHKEHEEVKSPEECVREAIEEIRQEEEERQRALEEWEEKQREKEEQLEESREERTEKANKDDYAELEERILENFDDYDIDPEEVKERWRERFEEEVKEQLDGPQNESEKADGEDDEQAGDEGRTVEGEVYYTDSSGQVHIVKTESDETAESKAESSIEVQEQSEESTEMPEPPESQEAEPKVEEGEAAPQDECSSQTQEGVVEHPHVREHEEGNEEVEKQSLETEPKEVTPEREKPTEESDNPHPETESSLDVDETVEGQEPQERHEPRGEESDEQLALSPEIDTEYHRTQEHEHQESEESSESDTSTEESREAPESREEEIWTSYELDNGSIEDEEWKRYLRELFNKLSEEEKVAFKEYLREQVQTIEDFEELLRKYGLEELLDEEDVMEEVRQFLEFKQTLEANPERSVEEIAEELGLDAEQALEWSMGESEPKSLKKLLNLEAYYLWDQIVRSYRERDFPKTREELERGLAEHSELRSSRFLSIEREEALAWIETMRMRRKGEIKKIIRNGRELYNREQITALSEKYGVSVGEIIKWLRGDRVPPLIVKLLEINQQGNKIKKSPKSNGALSKRGCRRTYSINITQPSINGIKISSYKQLMEILTHEKPQLMNRNDIQKLLRYCEVFLNLVNDFRNRNAIHSLEISSISKRTGLSITTIRDWLTKGYIPRLFYLLHTIPDQIANISLENVIVELERKTNGIVTMEMMLDRLGTLYIENKIQYTKKSMKDASNFFLVINAVQNGAQSIDQIAKITQVSRKRVESFLYYQHIPRIVNLISCIPEEKPESGWKWLPLTLTGARMKEFIEVPVEIKSMKDIYQVLEQLEALKTPRTSKLEQQFGNVSLVHLFLYFLGLSVSDGNFDSTKKSILASGRMKLKLAKKYPWSINVGNAYCHALERIGFKTTKGKDELTIRSDGTSSLMHSWRSKTSPFFIWVKTTLLGLEVSEKKSKTPINADWILDMPRDWRISFLQGISDGDSSASFQGQVLQIHTYTNQEFYKRILTSLGIRSYTSTTYVGIGEKKSIRLAEQLPIFRHASSRQENLSKLVLMLDSHNWDRITDKEEEFILDLHNQGYRVGEIIEKMWNAFGRTRRRSTIYKVIKRKSRNEGNG